MSKDAESCRLDASTTLT